MRLLQLQQRQERQLSSSSTTVAATSAAAAAAASEAAAAHFRNFNLSSLSLRPTQSNHRTRRISHPRSLSTLEKLKKEKKMNMQLGKTLANKCLIKAMKPEALALAAAAAQGATEAAACAAQQALTGTLLAAAAARSATAANPPAATKSAAAAAAATYVAASQALCTVWLKCRRQQDHLQKCSASCPPPLQYQSRSNPN